jgi:AraC family transcriptional regulator, transcriptional activator of pobA
MKTTTITDFYHEITGGENLQQLLPVGHNKEIGHFNIFSIADLHKKTKSKPVMPYNRRTYYKISLIIGRNTVEYADKVIEIENNGLLFATPKVPYHYVPKDDLQRGFFCVFTDEFLIKNTSGLLLDELPIFNSSGCPVFKLSDEETLAVEAIFSKMQQEIGSDYAFKYDLLRNYVLELIHYGQKLQPATTLHPAHTASARVSSLFLELLERQFPIDSPQQQLKLRTAKDYAGRLSVHVNHLNKVLKENTGKTTTHIIGERLVKEAKILLKQTDWNISEIGYCLGFEEVAHFSNFFKKQTSHSPLEFRS